MKKLLILPLLYCTWMRSQIPYILNSSGTTIYSSGTQVLSGNEINAGTTLYKITSNAQITNKAADIISVQPGFEADGFTSTGMAKLYIDQSMMDVVSFHPNGFSGIPQYARFEIGIKLPTAIQSQINSFLSGSTGLNPYDASQVQVYCTYVSPSNSSTIYTRYGFYYRDYAVVSNNWAEQSTDYSFRVRFAPPEVGLYPSAVYLLVNNSVVASSDFMFPAVSSSNPGHLLVANGNLRKLQYENGDMFFGVGQDIGFVIPANQTQYSCATWECRPPSQYDVFRGWISDLASNKGNFVRLRLDPFGFPIEWEENKMFTGDPSPTKTLAQCIGNYDHNQKYMWEFDKVMTLCESTDIRIMLNILQDQSWSFSPNASGLFNWSHNPYSSILGTASSDINTFFTNSTAKAHYKKMLYYMEARWGYSTSVGLWEMINEMENVENCKPINSNTQDVINWVCDMASYLQPFYPWHPTTNGTINDTSSTSQTCLNVWSQNSYNASLDNCGYSEGNFNQRASCQKEYYDNFKPFVFGEMGAGGPEIDQNMDRDFHNAVWATTMMGGIANGLYWNDFEQHNSVNHRFNFNSLREFTKRIDWTQSYVIGKDFSNGGSSCQTNNKTRQVFSFWERNGARNYAFGWAMNASSNWMSHQSEFVNQADYSTAMGSCTGLSNPYTVFDNTCNPQIHVNDLLNTTNYKITIYDPYDVNNAQLETRNELSDLTGNLKFRRKMDENIASPFYPDYCFMIEPVYGSRIMEPGINPTDTSNYHIEDTLCINAMQHLKQDDYKFSWSINEQYYSSDSIICLYHFHDSIIRVSLYAENKNEEKFYKDYVFVNDVPTSQTLKMDVKVTPNPASSMTYIYFINADPKTFKISVLNEIGQEVLNQSDKNELNVNALKNGFYLVKTFCEGKEFVNKLIINH